MRIKLIANAPDRDTVDTLQAEVNTLRTQGHEVRPSLTFEGGDARRFAEEAAADGTKLVIAAGGDGTINEVVNGFEDFLEVFTAGSPDNSPPPLPRLGLVPLGTGNDFATSLGVPNDIPSAVRVAVHGEPLEVDVGRVNERDFLNVSTGGVGAEATEETPSEIKNVIGPLAYLITGVRKFVTLESSPARFTADEVIYDGPFMVFAVGNSKLTGGGNRLTPKANLTDGLLDLCIVKEMPRMELLKLLPDLRAGRHLDHPAVLYRQVPHLRVESEQVLSVNADGEPLRSRCFDYALRSRKLTVSHPERRTTRRG